tara:strand:+ start:2104 stop:2337 length:234 start_codon:yes stop_codon:yes gene_type:complete
MVHNLKNPEYDDEFLLEKIASESPTFKSYIQQALKDTNKKYPTNQIWLGTLPLGKEKIETQVNLTITQEPRHFIDEN